MDKRATEYIEKKQQWKSELLLLREILLSTGLVETIKWGAPTYTFKEKNIVGMAAFKSYCGLWFFQGALLQDKHKVFINAQEGKTKAMLQWRFSSIEEIKFNLIREYVLEAIENQRQNKNIKPQRNLKPLLIPDLLKNTLNNDYELQRCFETFSTSKKREFADYIREAKREETKLKRIEKIIPLIKSQVGLNDQYKNC